MRRQDRRGTMGKRTQEFLALVKGTGWSGGK